MYRLNFHQIRTLAPALFLVLMFCSCAVSASRDDYQTEPTEREINGELAYILSNIRQKLRSTDSDSYPVLLQPSSINAKRSRFGNPSTKKRGGIWIWMPAQGYVSVPRDEVGGTSNKGSSSNLLRYG